MSVPDSPDSITRLAMLCVRCAENAEVERVPHSRIWEGICPNCGSQMQAWQVRS